MNQINFRRVADYVASRAPGGVCTLSYAEAAALVKIAEAAYLAPRPFDPNEEETRLLDNETDALRAFDFETTYAVYDVRDPARRVSA